MLRDWLHHMSHINHSAACRKGAEIGLETVHDAAGELRRLRGGASLQHDPWQPAEDRSRNGFMDVRCRNVSHANRITLAIASISLLRCTNDRSG
jgi:hypothetical protein